MQMYLLWLEDIALEFAIVLSLFMLWDSYVSPVSTLRSGPFQQWLVAMHGVTNALLVKSHGNEWI